MRRTTTAEAAHFSVTQIIGFDSAVRIEATVDPVSLQTDSDRKKTFQSALAAAIKNNTDRIFTGDVKAEITWFISEERRYNTHIVADIDNIIKPLFDAVTGPGGIMIDDNQVQQIGASWDDAEPGKLKFTMVITALFPSEFIPRHNLEFVDLGRPYGCMLVPDMPAEIKLMLITSVADAVRRHRALLAMGSEPGAAKMHMPMQRFYPSARLKGFEVKPLPGTVGSLLPDSQTVPALLPLDKNLDADA
ncbi:RusA family crossover junction endodeoxyribonuclease [Arthrobacter sp. PsM3]|uniref:RusA family crossover junction endodeoxyribonuclease n=1 Tax=Arthrobacter sp. PsM3 TaxID=3030531 RepID=UPI00263B7BDE|nr:RusA family crossover junction endodeoxyribonuclease [Arthrobacter sp. PsM3]MDN4644186.1 RusA family crossover junction endodeoxyribonuclease [Arthrobacter sp. PsM3]